MSGPHAEDGGVAPSNGAPIALEAFGEFYRAWRRMVETGVPDPRIQVMDLSESRATQRGLSLLARLGWPRAPRPARPA